jgi:Cu/Ag efflux protein CusF
MQDSQTPEMTFHVAATVTEVNPSKGKITLDHEKMEGYMEPMEMPFKVSNREVFAHVTVGFKGRFTIEVANGIGVIAGVEPLE